MSENRQTYKANLPIENEIVRAVSRCGDLKVAGGMSNNYNPYFEAVSYVYIIIPPGVREKVNKTDQLKDMEDLFINHRLPKRLEKKITLLNKFDRHNAIKQAMPVLKKQTSDLFLMKMNDLLYQEGLYMKARDRVQGYVGTKEVEQEEE